MALLNPDHRFLCHEACFLDNRPEIQRSLIFVIWKLTPFY